MNVLVYDHILLIHCAGFKICPQVLWLPYPVRWYLCPSPLLRASHSSLFSNQQNSVEVMCCLSFPNWSEKAMQLFPDVSISLKAPFETYPFRTQPPCSEECTSHKEVMHRCSSQQIQPRCQNVSEEAILEVNLPAPDVQGHSHP